jgi:cytoskeletal protein CcmA (bactofilin family)
METQNAFAKQYGAAPASKPGTLLKIEGSGARIEGKFQIAESIEIQCEVTGELAVGGTLLIGERGKVSADVSTVNAVIVGNYTGNLKASGSVEIASTGRVAGTVESNELVIAKGAVFTGSVSHVEKTQPRAATQPTAQPALANRAQPQAQPTAQPAVPSAAPAPPVSDMETTIPVARLVELDVGNNDARGTQPPGRQQTFGVS